MQTISAPKTIPNSQFLTLNYPPFALAPSIPYNSAQATGTICTRGGAYHDTGTGPMRCLRS